MSVLESNETSTAIQTATSGPAKLVEFLKDTRAEMHKVVTPTPAEVKSTTIVVLVTVFLFAAFFFAVDAVLGRGIDKMIVFLTKH